MRRCQPIIGDHNPFSEIRDNPAQVSIDGDEIDYLVAAVNRYFAKSVTRQEIVWTYSGVRPWLGKAWTGKTTLPGGETIIDFAAFLADFRHRRGFLAPEVALRLARAYGARADKMLGTAASMGELGHDFGYGLTEREVEYLKASEWAVTADDILWRRSKLGLHLSAQSKADLANYLANPNHQIRAAP